jgi:hypothetical protein
LYGWAWLNYTSQRDVTGDLSPRRILRLFFESARRLAPGLW